MLFEDVGRGVWSSVVYCGCITSELIPSGWGIPPSSPNQSIPLNSHVYIITLQVSPLCNMVFFLLLSLFLNLSCVQYYV